jgi:hypothetical protein
VKLLADENPSCHVVDLLADCSGVARVACASVYTMYSIFSRREGHVALRDSE